MSEPRHKLPVRLPSRKELLDELVRLKVENQRMTRLVATQRPELEKLRAIEVGLRDYLNSSALQRIHAECCALLPGNDDLPSIDEIRGSLSRAADVVEAAIQERAK